MRPQVSMLVPLVFASPYPSSIPTKQLSWELEEISVSIYPYRSLRTVQTCSLRGRKIIATEEFRERSFPWTRIDKMTLYGDTVDRNK